jgi:acyl carrier protein
MHMGRRDSQVKIRGRRIELSEIELALRGLSSVKTAVVEARARGDGEKALVGYIVPAGGVAPSVSDLRHGLSRILPDYMIPSAFVWIDNLPLLPNGKVDRHALPPAPPRRPSLDAPYALPRTSTEAHLAGIWAEILSLPAIGVDDPFLELGGDSLQAARILARIADVFSVELPVELLFGNAATVASMARAIEAALSTNATVDHG